MTFAEELYRMFIGNPNMLSKRENKLLKVLVYYPGISKFSLIALAMVLGISSFIEFVLGVVMDSDKLVFGVVFMAVMAAILLTVAITTKVIANRYLNSAEYNEIANRAINLVKEASTAELYGVEMNAKRMGEFVKLSRNPLFLCDFYHINRKRGFEKWIVIIVLILMVGMYAPRFVDEHNVNEAKYQVVINTENKIVDKYKNICEYVDATDPHEYRSNEYTVHMRAKEGVDEIAGFTLYVDNDGKICDYYFTARTNKARTAEENIKLINDYYTKYQHKLDELSKEGVVVEPDLLTLKYQIAGEFAQKIKAYYNSKEDVRIESREVEADNGTFYIYETYNDSNGNIHISPIYIKNRN